MVCFPWWWLLIVIVGAGAFGFIACFVWQWWLLSRPDRRT
jgi:hypothetical protein